MNKSPPAARSKPVQPGSFGIWKDITSLPLRFPQDTTKKDEEDFWANMTPATIMNLILADVPGDIRKYIESKTPTIQCKKAFESGNLDAKFVSGQTRCWLCGCIIYEKTDTKPFNDWQKWRANQTNLVSLDLDHIMKENGPECEHIIPALRACMLVGMFTDTDKMNKIEAQYSKEDWEDWKTEVAHNYLWAHGTCNGGGGKSGMVLFEYKRNAKSEPIFVYDKIKGNKSFTRGS